LTILFKLIVLPPTGVVPLQERLPVRLGMLSGPGSAGVRKLNWYFLGVHGASKEKPLVGGGST
jgi:hypothetical protein